MVGSCSKHKLQYPHHVKVSQWGLPIVSLFGSNKNSKQTKISYDDQSTMVMQKAQDRILLQREMHHYRNNCKEQLLK